MAKKKKNSIYLNAKEISTINDENKKIDLLIKLNTSISDGFKSGNIESIEDAIDVAINLEDVSTTNILLDEVHFEIENACLDEDSEGDTYSTMLIMPCVIISNEKTSVPSINDFESIVCKHLLNNSIIQEEHQFSFGAVRFNEDDVNDLTLHDWWEIHRKVVDDYQNSSSDNQVLRNKIVSLESKNSISLFYFVNIVVSKENNDQIIDNLYISQSNIEMWDMINTEINELNGSARFILFPPMSLAESIDNSKYIMQSVEFDMFFDEFGYEDNVDVGYIQLEDNKDNYAILFFDNEDQTLSQYFIYETYGEPEGLMSILLEKCSQEPRRNLFSFDIKVSSEMLTNWSNTHDAIDLTQLIKESNSIDIDEAYRLFNINNPSIDNNTKQTLH